MTSSGPGSLPTAEAAADGRPDADSLRALLDRAVARHRDGALAEAAEAYQAVLRASPRQPDVLHHLGLVRRAQGDLGEAIRLFRAALAIDGTAVRCCLALANAHAAGFDLVSAAHDYRLLIMLDPANAEYLRRLGALLQWDRRPGAAAALFRRALAAAPDDAGLRRQTAAALVEAGDAAAAERCLRAASPEAGDAETLVVLAAALRVQGRHAEALAACERALAGGGDDLDLHLGLAASLEALGRRTEASGRLAAAAPRRPARDLLRLAQRLFDLGDADAAQAAYRRFADLADDRRRFPNAGLRHLAVRPAAALCGERGWPYHRVAAAQARRVVADDGREHAVGLPEVFLARVEDAEIVPSNRTVIAGDALLLDGLSTDSRASLTLLPHFVAHAADDRMLLDLPEPSVTIEEEAILLGGGINWSHGVLDWASKLAVLERFPDLDRLPVLVAHDTPGSILDLFAMLGVAHGRLRRLPAGEPVRARRLWLPSLTHAYQGTAPLHVDFLRRRLAGPIAEGLRRPRRRLFLSRRRAGYRALVNEAEVLAVLAPFGVEPVVPEDFPMAEQIALFAAAELIVGPIGGGSAAVAFAAPGAAYVELVHDRIALPQYGILTALLGQRYRQIAGPVRGNRGRWEFDYDFEVAPAEVAAAVRDLLGPG